MNIWELLKVIFFGIVEGITEWLPVSSTGHMILVEHYMKLDVSREFWDMFLVVIQLGAILAVVVLFWKQIFPFHYVNDVNGINKSNSPNSPNHFDKKFHINIDMDIMQMWFKVMVAVLPAIVIALPFDDIIEEMFYTPLTVALMLIAYGILFIVVERWNKGKETGVSDMEQLTYKMALFIGIFQILALIPGTSRSGATIIGAMLIGTSRKVAAEFTFYLAIPVMFGASLLRLVKFGFHFTAAEFTILFVGMLTAFIVSVFVIKFLMDYIKKHDFQVFGWYRIALGIVLLLFIK